ncbi:MAG: protein phosphatase 2C domain-containing protein [Actinomycetota bacterium]|nr:protein phosphatase 2C domain-containing protein [Actinomycetota bacterium]
MRVHSAILAGGEHNHDRLFVTDNAVIVLDGASTFEPVEVDAGLYTETLGAAIAEQLAQQPSLPIADAVATAIRHTVHKLDLTAGRSPSSTVSVLRAGAREVHLYVLGDSPIHYGTQGIDRILTDDRLSSAAIPECDRYLSQLRAGRGYTTEHQAALVALQRAQRHARNRACGYWIAETDPAAAHHALTTTIRADAITWTVLATDGAADVITHTGPSWPTIADYNPDDLAALLDHLHHWEYGTDPTGYLLPRAKQHDDKTIAAVTFVRP